VYLTRFQSNFRVIEVLFNNSSSPSTSEARRVSECAYHDNWMAIPDILNQKSKRKAIFMNLSKGDIHIESY